MAILTHVFRSNWREALLLFGLRHVYSLIPFFQVHFQIEIVLWKLFSVSLTSFKLTIFEKLLVCSSKSLKCSYLVLVSPQRRTVWSEDNPHPALLCLHIRSLRKIQCHFYKEEKEEEVRVLHKDASAPPSIPLDWPQNWHLIFGLHLPSSLPDFNWTYLLLLLCFTCFK